MAAWPLSFRWGGLYSFRWQYKWNHLALRSGELLAAIGLPQQLVDLGGWRFFQPGNAGGWVPGLPSARVLDFVPDRTWITLTIPLWCILVGLTVPTTILWWKDRRSAKGHCAQCGYDLTGNLSGTCPECGKRV